MSFLSDLGGTVISAVTGTSPSDLQAEVTTAEQQLTLAVETIIGLELVLVVETFLVVVLLWKLKRQ